MAKAIHGLNEMEIPGGMTVSRVREALGQVLNIPAGAESLVNGKPVPKQHVVGDKDTLEFISQGLKVADCRDGYLGMTSTALDIRAPGIDRDSGYGIVMVSAAVNAILH